MLKGGSAYRFVTDQLGSVRAVVDAASGSVVQEMRYDAWGVVLSDSAPGFQPFGFAGGLWDADTGLVRFGARDYDAEVGRWTSKDPIRFAGDGANLFSYTRNNPVNMIDVNGRFPIPWDIPGVPDEVIPVPPAFLWPVAAAGAVWAAVDQGIKLYDELNPPIYGPEPGIGPIPGDTPIVDDPPICDDGSSDHCNESLKACLASRLQGKPGGKYKHSRCTDCFDRCNSEGLWPSRTWDGKSCRYWLH